MARASINRRLRWLILARDNFTCSYCGRSPRKHGVALDVDHIKSKAQGGGDEPENLTTACDDCNQGKGDGRYPALLNLNVPSVWTVWSLGVMIDEYPEKVCPFTVRLVIDVGRAGQADEAHNIICGGDGWPAIAEGLVKLLPTVQ